MQQFGVGGGGKCYLGGALPFSSQIDAADQIAISIAQSGRVLLKALSELRKNKASG